MANSIAQTAIDNLNDITNELIDNYLETDSVSLINKYDFKLKRLYKKILALENDAKALHGEDYAKYYSTLGLYYSAIGNTDKAKEFYAKAMRLNSPSEADLANFNMTLLKNADFDEVESNLRAVPSGQLNDVALLNILYQIGVRNLDFSLFLDNYLPLRHKDCFSKGNIQRLEGLYEASKSFEGFAEDLKKIGITKKRFAEFYDILNKFHGQNFLGSLKACYTIENDDEQYLTVDIYADISIDEASEITRKFDTVLVNHAMETGNKRLLSQFFVYYKPYALLEDNTCTVTDAYLGMNEDMAV